MLLFDEYKNLIFFEESLKNDLINRIKKIGFQIESFDEAYEKLFKKLNNQDLQRTLAPFLRNLAIHQLRHSESELCKGIRESYQVITSLPQENREVGDYVSLDEFVKHQARNGIFASHLEASVLAEILNVNFAATHTDSNGIPNGNPYNYHSISDAERTVHLYNSANTHFFIFERNLNSTIPDGNCMYNGYAQFLQQFVLHELRESNENLASSDNLLDDHIEFFKNQQLELQKIKNLPEFSPKQLVELSLKNLREYQKEYPEDLAAAMLGEEQISSADRVSQHLSKINFAGFMEEFKALKKTLDENQKEAASKALSDFVQKIEKAKQDLEKKPNDVNAFINACKKTCSEAKSSALQDFSEWNFISRGFMKAINYLASFVTKDPIFKSPEYSKIRFFANQVEEIESPKIKNPSLVCKLD